MRSSRVWLVTTHSSGFGTRPGGTMTALQGACWTGTGWTGPRPRKRGPEVEPFAACEWQAPRWSAGRRARCATARAAPARVRTSLRCAFLRSAPLGFGECGKGIWARPRRHKKWGRRSFALSVMAGLFRPSRLGEHTLSARVPNRDRRNKSGDDDGESEACRKKTKRAGRR